MKKVVSSLVLLAWLSICNIGCGLTDSVKDATDQLTAALDRSITQLQGTSAGWQTVAGNLSTEVSQIVKDSEDKLLQTVKNDIINSVDRIPHNIGEEIKCDADFFKDRFVEQLVKIKVNLLGGNLPVFKPALCGVVPTAFIMGSNLPVIDFSGYNLDYEKNIKVLVVDRSGNKRDVTTALTQPTHYHWTLNVASNGVNPTSQDDKIIVEFDNQEVSSLPIVQPNPPVCQSEEYDVVVATPKYVPPHVAGKGDTKFGGSQVNTTVIVNLTVTKKQVYAQTSMQVVEWKNNGPTADQTTGSGTSSPVLIYTAPEDKEIEKIAAPTHLVLQQVFTAAKDQQEPITNMEGGLGQFKLYINRPDEDVVGVWTGVELNFTKLPVILKKSTNCLSTNVISQLSPSLRARLLSPVVRQAMKFPLKVIPRDR